MALKHFHVGQVVEHMNDGHPGVVISVEPFAHNRPHLGDYVVVLWGVDDEGWLTGGWLVNEHPPLTKSKKPVPAVIAAEMAAARA